MNKISISYKADDYPLLSGEEIAPVYTPGSVVAGSRAAGGIQVANNQESNDNAFSKYNTTATGNINDDVYSYAMMHAFGGDTNANKQPLMFGAGERLTNDDFYKTTGIPLVAGSISGKVIGTQLIIGGGEGFSQFPWAVMMSERNRLQNILANAIKPANAEDIKFDYPKIPDVDGRYADQFREGWNNMIDRHLGAAYKYGKKGLKYLTTPGTPAYNKFKQDQDNMSFAAKSINDILKYADNVQKTIDTKNLQVDNKTQKDLGDLISGSVDIMHGKSIGFNLKDKLQSLKYGMGVAEVGKSVKDTYFRPIEEILKIANNVKTNGDYNTYATLLEQSKTEFGLDGYFPEGKNWNNATPEEIESAQKAKAKDIVTPLLQQNFGETPPKEVIERSANYVYETMRGLQKTINVQSVGTRKFEGNKTTVNVNANLGKNPVPGSFTGYIQAAKVKGYSTVGTAGGNQMRILRSPSGDIMTQALDKSGNIVPNSTKKYNPADSDLFLTETMSGLKGIGYPTEDVNTFNSYINTKSGEYPQWQGMMSNFNEGFKTYQQYIDEKYKNKDATYKQIEASKFVNMAKYTELNQNTVIPINDKIATKINYKAGGELTFTDENGSTFVPSTITNKVDKSKALSTGSNTIVNRLSTMPSTTLEGAYIKFSGAQAVVYKKIDGQEEKICEYPVSSLSQYLKASFNPTSVKGQLQNTEEETYEKPRNKNQKQSGDMISK